MLHYHLGKIQKPFPLNNDELNQIFLNRSEEKHMEGTTIVGRVLRNGRNFLPMGDAIAHP